MKTRGAGQNFRRAGKPPQLCPVRLPTPEGEFLAWYSNIGLARLDFPKLSGVGRIPMGAPAPFITRSIRNWHARTVRALLKALKGRATGNLPPLDLSSGTAFQQQVWHVMASVPCGTTISYGEIACAIRKPGAARAVGQACGANPIPVLVPCHRVLAAGGRVGGFSGGLGWKRKLLKAEGVSVQC